MGASITQTKAESAARIIGVSMKVKTEICAGNLLEDAIQNFENLSNQAIDFVSAAEGQASNLTTTVAHAAENAWQYLASIVNIR
jgi:hypothetical protein